MRTHPSVCEPELYIFHTTFPVFFDSHHLLCPKAYLLWWSFRLCHLYLRVTEEGVVPSRHGPTQKNTVMLTLVQCDQEYLAGITWIQTASRDTLSSWASVKFSWETAEFSQVLDQFPKHWIDRWSKEHRSSSSTSVLCRIHFVSMV